MPPQNAGAYWLKQRPVARVDHGFVDYQGQEDIDYEAGQLRPKKKKGKKKKKVKKGTKKAPVAAAAAAAGGSDYDDYGDDFEDTGGAAAAATMPASHVSPGDNYEDDDYEDDAEE